MHVFIVKVTCCVIFGDKVGYVTPAHIVSASVLSELHVCEEALDKIGTGALPCVSLLPSLDAAAAAAEIERSIFFHPILKRQSHFVLSPSLYAFHNPRHI